MKKTFSVLLLFFATVLTAKAAAADFALTLPKDLEGPLSGQTVEFRFEASGFEPSAVNPMTLYAVEQDYKVRYNIRTFKVPNANGIYEASWKIPANYFSQKDRPFRAINFIIRLNAKTDAGWMKINFPTRFRVFKDQAAKDILQPLQSPITGELPAPPATPVPPALPAPPATFTLTPLGDLHTARNIVEGSQKILVAEYAFTGQYESYTVDKLTVVNDSQGDGFDNDSTEVTDVIKTIYISYKDKEGNVHQHQSSLSGNSVTFGGMDFFVPRYDEVKLQVGADVVSRQEFNSTLSGRTFRLGIQDIGNTASTFNSVGNASGETFNSFGFGMVKISGSEQIPENVARFGYPEFTMSMPSNDILTGGEQEIYRVDVKAVGGGVTLARMVFDVNQSGLSAVDQIKLWRGNQFLTPGDAVNANNVYLMWDAGATSCFAHTAQGGAGTGMDCNGGTADNSKLIVTFPQEQVIAEGETLTFRLYATVMGAASGTSINVRLNNDAGKPVLAGAAQLNGKIWNGGAGNKLFSSATDFVNEATAVTNRDIIWSDQSAQPHGMATVTAGTSPATSANSSGDWTNGYLLYTNALSAVHLSR